MNEEKKKELLELSETLRGIAEGKEWGYSFGGSWYDASEQDDPVIKTMQGYFVRLKPWSLPPPPEGLKWHRTDGWEEGDLPEGYRPFLLGEISVKPDHRNVMDQVKLGEEWGTLGEGEQADRTCCHLRTRRPLPSPPKPKKRVPLGPEDIRAGDEFLNPEGMRCQWGRISPCGLSVFINGKWREFHCLMDEGWRKRSLGQSDWQPCYKEVEE